MWLEAKDIFYFYFFLRIKSFFFYFELHSVNIKGSAGRGVHVTGVSATYTFKLNKNLISL
jgi:hypothetical protein